MKKRIVLATFFLGLLTLTSYITANSIMSLSFPTSADYLESSKPTMYVENVTLPISEVFDVNVTVPVDIEVENAIEPFMGFMFSLRYNAGLLNVTRVINETSMLRDTLSVFMWNVTKAGEVWVYAVADGMATGIGTLATIEFLSSGVGEVECALELYGTQLYSYVMKMDPIDHNRKNGRIEQTPLAKPVLAPLNVSGYCKLRYDLSLTVGDLTTLFNIVADNTTLDLNNKLVVIEGTKQTGFAVRVSAKSNIVIKDAFLLSRFEKGLIIEGYRDRKCYNITIINVHIVSSSNEAIQLEWSNDVQIVNSSIKDNCLKGISAESCDNITIIDVQIDHLSSEGVYLKESNGAQIVNCSIAGCQKGILAEGCDNITISGNNITGNHGTGIVLSNSHNCTIIRNRIENNTGLAGVCLSSATKNKIWSNDFLNNSQHVECIEKSENNQWNMSYPLGGNFWDDYAENKTRDTRSGINRSILGPDGIGDEPVEIDGYNKDYYPLMYEFGTRLKVFCGYWIFCNAVGKANDPKSAPAGFFTDSSVQENSFRFNMSDASITFNITNATFCRAIICRELLDGVLEVFVDEVPTTCCLNWEGNYVFANFTCDVGVHTIRIKGQWVARIEGDVNGDGKVNIVDMSTVAKHFGEYRTPPE